MTKFWVDDVRPSPSGYKHIHSVDEFIFLFEHNPKLFDNLGIKEFEIDLAHDSGEYYKYGGDYINILNYLEHFAKEYSIIVKFHTMNPVGLKNMQLIVDRNINNN
mgnify:CR=1 FL=1